MENLTNEQIVDIINFYKECGISEDMYLSRNGVLDIFSLIGMTPKFDEQGNRLPTVYEQLSIAPVFRDKKEVPIVFAIKHKVSKIYKPKEDDKISTDDYTFVGEKEDQVNDRVILNKLKQDYFSAIVNGNLSEATRLYDLIDRMTGGKAERFIGIQYNSVKFYKKMQKQLLIDMFANFVILMILSEKHSVKDGIVKFNKLYKAFIQKQLSSGNFGLIKNKSINIPEINQITISISEDQKIKGSNVKANLSKGQKTDAAANVPKPETNRENHTFVSFVKEKINHKLSKLRKSFEERIFSSNKEKFIEEESEKEVILPRKSEQTIKILESD